jgi:hypothetical protein
MHVKLIIQQAVTILLTMVMEQVTERRFSKILLQLLTQRWFRIRSYQTFIYSILPA